MSPQLLTSPAGAPAVDFEVLIIGAGFGGIGAGIALRKAGVENFLIVDKWQAVGGTWLANTYPGVAVDIPSFIYSFSFEQRSEWSRIFAPGEELRQYAEHVVDKYDLRAKLRLGTNITLGAFDEDRHLWRISTDTGDEITARFVISAVGGLERPKLPDIDGVETFAGKLMHTAAWDHDYDLKGKRIAVIGTGATALQLVPTIADTVEHLTVFQRTPIWVAPKPDYSPGPGTKAVLRRRLPRAALRMVGHTVVEAGLAGLLLLHDQVPYVIKGAERGLRKFLRSQIPDDPELREKLTPKYALGCKRPSLSNTYLKSFTRPDVDLVTEPIERITENAVISRDGAVHEIDMVVCATGFKVMEKGATPAYPIRGRDGVELGEFWDTNRYQAYQGVSVPGFPNMFNIVGPYAFAPGSYFVMIESTAAHAARAISETLRSGMTSCEIRRGPHDRYFQKCLRRAAKLPLVTPACAGSNTYYLNYQGDSAAIRPSGYAEMWWQNRRFPLDDYRYSDLAERSQRPAPAAPVTKKESV